MVIILITLLHLLLLLVLLVIVRSDCHAASLVRAQPHSAHGNTVHK